MVVYPSLLTLKTLFSFSKEALGPLGLLGPPVPSGFYSTFYPMKLTSLGTSPKWNLTVSALRRADYWHNALQVHLHSSMYWGAGWF